MRTRLVLASFAILALVALSGAQSPAVSDSALGGALSQIRPEAIHAHIAFLADDLLEGRGTGTRGYQLAAKYVAAQFEALGLKPAGANGTYFQPVPLRKTEVIEQQCSISLVRNGQAHELVYGKDYLMAGDFLRAETSVEAPVVFAGFGVTAPEANYDDYAGMDVRGKIVAVLRGAPASLPHDQRAYYSSGTVKRGNAVAHGAVGILAFLMPEDQKRYRWEWIARQNKMGEMAWLDEKGAPHDVSPEIRGTALLSGAGVEALFAGAPKSLEEMFATAQAGKPQAFELPVRARLRKASRQSQVESANVVAVLPGSDPQLKGEYVVYTAHLDHLGVGEPVDGDAIYNGAFDNASGTAGLLEVARAFASLPERPRRSVLFLEVTGEEKGLLGSDYFVHYPTVAAKSLIADVNFDMALTLYPLRDVIGFGAEHSTLGQVVEQAAKRLDLEMSPDPMPEEVVFIRSDQYSFVRRGVPAVFLVCGWKSGDPKVNGREAVQQWLQSRYHTPKDDVNQPMDLNAAVKFAQVNFLVGYAVANQTARPAWTPGDFFGEKFGHPTAGSH